MAFDGEVPKTQALRVLLVFLARAQNPDGFRATRFAQKGRAENKQEVITMEAIINEKAMRGIERFLERRGMEILETGWAHGNDKIDFIAKDEDDLAFISCTIRTNEGNGLGAEALDRKMFERIAAAYLAEHLDFPEGAIRHDAVTMLILGDSKALIRYHLNALSAASKDLG